MDINSINVVSEAVSCPLDKSPIFFVNITGEIIEKKSEKSFIYVAEKIVLKGTLEELIKSDQTKKQFLREFFKDVTDKNKKVNNFDLSKIKITNIEIIRGLGYGIK